MERFSLWKADTSITSISNLSKLQQSLSKTILVEQSWKQQIRNKSWHHFEIFFLIPRCSLKICVSSYVLWTKLLYYRSIMWFSLYIQLLFPKLKSYFSLFLSTFEDVSILLLNWVIYWVILVSKIFSKIFKRLKSVVTQCTFVFQSHRFSLVSSLNS